MINCEKCVFSKCCQDSGSNPKNCTYNEEDRNQIVLYRIKHHMMPNEETTLNDEMIAETLRAMQKDRVMAAKSNLVLMLSTVFLVVLLVVSFVAMWVSDTQEWARIFMQIMIGAVGVGVACVVLYMMYTGAKYVLDNAKIIMRGR